jgi:hypothetical protein
MLYGLDTESVVNKSQDLNQEPPAYKSGAVVTFRTIPFCEYCHYETVLYSNYRNVLKYADYEANVSEFS